MPQYPIRVMKCGTIRIARDAEEVAQNLVRTPPLDPRLLTLVTGDTLVTPWLHDASPRCQAQAMREELIKQRHDRKRERQKEENAPKLAAAMEDVSKAMSEQAEAREGVKGAMAAGLQALKKKKKKKKLNTGAAPPGVPLGGAAPASPG